MGRFPFPVLVGLLFMTANPCASQFLVHRDLNKALYGHSFLNISAGTMENCLQRCLANCSCLSFQMCDRTKCQLCSSNKYLEPEALREAEGCSNFDFGNQETTEVSNEQCSSSCTTGINCCMTSNPCLNGGTCLPLFSNSERRFKCKCPDSYEGDRCERREQCEPGYTGKDCDEPIRSCRGYRNGTRVPGYYTVTDDDDNSFRVFCDFDNNTPASWTLVQSYSLSNKGQVSKAFYQDAPLGENDPSWVRYRLSKSRMESVQQDSPKWRFTCRYDTDGVVHTDYVRGSNSDVNILTFNADSCVNVEYINVRGQDCSACTAFMVQGTGFKLPLHFDSYYSQPKGCYSMSSGSEMCNTFLGAKGEDNFGLYDCVNDQHRCSSAADATTQTWFGGE